MRTALIVVDAQADFIDGPLGGQGDAGIGERLGAVHAITRLAPESDLIVASRDWHPPDHCSFAEEPTYEDGSWPAHCVQGTYGAEINPVIATMADVIVNKGTQRNVEQYSAFEGDAMIGRLSMKLDKLLGDLGVERVLVCGFVTEYCVRRTAEDARALGYETHMVPEASAWLNPLTGTAAMRELSKGGVVVDLGPRFRSRYE